jgi:hypothetical protein
VSRRVNPRFLALLCACAGVLGLPTLAWAASGGAGVAPAPGGSGSGAGRSGGAGGRTGASGPTAQPGDETVTASDNGITISARASALLRNALVISGNAPGGDAGRTVEIERFGVKTRWTWQPTAQATVASDGSFSALWRANHIGRFALRAVIIQTDHATAASGLEAVNVRLPSVSVTVYLPALATLYGPGFYGRRTACGVVLRRHTIGVAHRWLRCGTPVAIYYQGRTLVVPVIDRGPYANGASWDLTIATGRALGMEGTEDIGAVSLPHKR